MGQTVAEIKAMLEGAGEHEFAQIERALAADTRAGVLRALSAARKRIHAQRAECERVAGMYAYEQEIAGRFCAGETEGFGARGEGAQGGAAGRFLLKDSEPYVGAGSAGISRAPYVVAGSAGISRAACVVLGLDEVGRGPLAGPLAIGAVVWGGAGVGEGKVAAIAEDASAGRGGLEDASACGAGRENSEYIAGLNDSKKLSAAAREEIASVVRESAVFCDVVFVSPEEIDAHGIGGALRCAFSQGIERAFAACARIDAVLLDGNPMHLHEREISVVKGDAKCASIAAASIVAKVERDALMCKLAREYPEYKWDENKGYGSAAHIEAIKKFGLTPYHRKSFCSNFTQESLF